MAAQLYAAELDAMLLSVLKALTFLYLLLSAALAFLFAVVIVGVVISFQLLKFFVCLVERQFTRRTGVRLGLALS